MRDISLYTGPLFIGSDHGGYALKKRLVRFIINELKSSVDDLGPDAYVEDDDYPIYASRVAEAVRGSRGRGILICKNGIGVCIAANKYDGVRAGIGYNIPAAESMRADDDTNILCLAAHHLSEDHACAIVRTWLTTPFSEQERHRRRLSHIEKITEAEKEQ